MRRSALIAIVVSGVLLNSTSAGASTSFGPDLTTGSAGGTIDCTGFAFSAGTGTALSNNCNTVLTYDAGASASAPVSGVLVAFKIRMGTAITGHLRVLTNAGGNPDSGPLVYKGTAADVSVPGDGAVHSYPVRLPISTGDLIAFGSPTHAPYRSVANSFGRIVGDTTNGSTPPEATLSGAEHNVIQAPISGVIEADADADGFGDETQDQCVGAAGPTNGCPNRTLTVSKAGGGAGTVTSVDAQIGCGATCSHAYAQGTSVTLNASPAAGSKFAGWSGGGCSGTGSCVVAVNADTTVTATFNPAPPDTQLTNSKINAKKGSAKFTFNSTGSSTGFQCSLVKKGKSVKFSDCDSPKTYKNLKDGKYSFQVRAVGAGGPDPTPAKTGFTLK